MTRNLIFALIGAAAFSITPTAAFAEAMIPSGDQAWYYAIGGAEPVSVALNPNGTNQILDLNAAMNVGYSCGNFDITSSVSNAFSNVATSLQNKIMSAAKGAIAALPLYVFQRANPGLYEMFQSYTADFSLNFGDALKTCEEMERDILAGKDPYAEWVQMAKAADWRTMMTTTTDAVEAKKQVESNNGSNGIKFPKVSSGAVVDAGGSGQPPIEPIRDVTEAGWNTTLGRPPASNAPYTPPYGTQIRLVELFPTPQDAGDWAVETIGDTLITTCSGSGCPKRAQPGNGLTQKYSKERETVAADMATLIGGTGTPSDTDLKKVSAPGVGISSEAIQALRELPPDQRDIMTGRLASDVAIARVIEKALAIRRMLISGRLVPEVAASEPALKKVEEGVALIEREIDSFLYEHRVQKEIASSTVSAVLAKRAGMEAASQGTAPAGRPPEDGHLRDGAVKP